SPRTRPGLALAALFVSLTWLLAGASPPTTSGGKASEAAGPASPIIGDGVASYYGKEHHGKKTANGEIFDMNKLTAAHLSLSFGSQVKVTNLSNQRSVIVRINDRRPYYPGPIIDLSLTAASRQAIAKAGMTNVQLA